jgi:hypothetical protein
LARSFDTVASRRISENSHSPLPWNQGDYQALLIHLKKETTSIGHYRVPGGTGSLSYINRVALGSPTNLILLLTQITIPLPDILNPLSFHPLGYRSTYPKILLFPRSKIPLHQSYHQNWQQRSRRNIGRVTARISIPRLLSQVLMAGQGKTDIVKEVH